MEEETTMMIPPQGMDEDMSEGIASLPEQGNSGIADLPQAAQQLAQLGRAQDTFLGHLAQDEVVIPRELLQASPELEEVIRNAFEAEGMDYTQYVVGSDENSINPETGLPEFFIKKALKKIERTVRKPIKGAGKALKKVEKVTRKKFKKVARELKRAAPVVLPIALTLLAGPNAGIVQQMLLSGAGSGISTLLAGGDLNDALKNAAISAAITGAISGTQEALAQRASTANSAETFKKAEETKKVLEANQQAIDQLVVDPKLARSTTSPSSTTGIDISADIKTPTAPVPKPKVPTVENVSMGQKIHPQPIKPVDPGKLTKNMIRDLNPEGLVTKGGGVRPKPPPSFFDRVKSGYETFEDYLIRGGRSEAEIALAKEKAEADYLARLANLNKTSKVPIRGSMEAIDAARAAQDPGMLARFGPTTALITGGLYASGAFDQEQPEESEEARAFRQQLAEDRAFAANIPQMGSPAGIDYITGQQTLAGAPNYQYLNPLYQGGYFLNNPTLNTGIAMAKGGGEMAVTNLDVSKFPRRTGRISGPGTETSDSIPAMLSDGEFVMNARAVRGAGNGSREAGVRKMYDMMRNFESKVA